MKLARLGVGAVAAVVFMATNVQASELVNQTSELGEKGYSAICGDNMPSSESIANVKKQYRTKSGKQALSVPTVTKECQKCVMFFTQDFVSSAKKLYQADSYVYGHMDPLNSVAQKYGISKIDGNPIYTIAHNVGYYEGMNYRKCELSAHDWRVIQNFDDSQKVRPGL